MTVVRIKYSEEQPRDEDGKWTSDGGRDEDLSAMEDYMPPSSVSAPVHEPPPIVPEGHITRMLVDPATARNLERWKDEQERDDHRAGVLDDRRAEAYNLMGFIFSDGLRGRAWEQNEARVSKTHDRILSAVQYNRLTPGVLKIELLASLQKGEGTYWINRLEKMAKTEGLDLKLESLPDAEEFYQKLGFVKTRDRVHRLQVMEKKLHAMKALEDEATVEFEDVGALALNAEVAAAMGLLGTVGVAEGPEEDIVLDWSLLAKLPAEAIVERFSEEAA